MMNNAATGSSPNAQIDLGANPAQLRGCNCGAHLRRFASALGAGPFRNRIFAISQCASCGLGFTSPVPSSETAHLLYETREDSEQFQTRDSPLVSKLKAFAARRDARSFCTGANPNGAFLDYGCGNGAFVRAIKGVFPKCRAIGSDLHQSAPTLLCEDEYLPYSRLQPTSFDFILCRHVLEHTYEPVEFLTRLLTFLRPGGILAIEVPSLQTGVRHLFGKYWDGYYVPYHPIHFTRESLAAAVEAAGMSLLRQGGAEMPKMGRSIANVIGCDYNIGLFAIGVLLQPIQVAIGWMTRSSVCLRVWARKDES